MTADLVAMAIAIVLAGPIATVLAGVTDATHIPNGLAINVIPLGIALVTALSVQGRYRDRLGFRDELRRVTSVALAACATLGLIGTLTGAPVAPWLLALLAFPVLSAATGRLAKSGLARAGLWTVPVLLLGEGPGAAEAEATALADRLRGYHIAARVASEAVTGSNAQHPLRDLLNRHEAERVLISVDGDARQSLAVAQALRERVDFAVVLPAFTLPTFTADTVRPLACDATLLLSRHSRRYSVAHTAKAALDVVGAALLLTFLTPLLLIIAGLVRHDGGPALYAHRRLGRGGRKFDCLKFRTMVVNGDEVLEKALIEDPGLAAEWAMTRKLRKDPRVTTIGRFLRRTSLDELPQLINVLRLEMSLVGPRPIVASEVPFYGEDIAHYYAGRPGLTGLWQVSGRSNTSYQRRVELDVWYVNNWTLWSDITVLLMTIPAVLARDGAA